MTVLASMLTEFDISHVTISDNGDCHNVGNGIWQANKYLSHPYKEIHINQLEKIKQPVLGTHVIKQFPSRVAYRILINYDKSDYKHICTMKAIKADTLSWNTDAFNNIKGDSWPLYSKNNIVESKTIRDEIINVHNYNETMNWIKDIDTTAFDYVIDFKTIHGIDNKQLSTVIATICNKPVTTDVYNFIKQYQKINQRLYTQ
jgi:hypothetical protein